MPKLHKTHLHQLKIDTKHPNLSLTDVAAALPPTSRKHARSVTSDAAPEKDRGKKRSLHRHALLRGSESPDSLYDPSESGVSDDGSLMASALQSRKRADSHNEEQSVKPVDPGHSPADRWMQFTSPETMSGAHASLEYGMDCDDNKVLARSVGIYQANSIIGARDQRVNAHFNDVHVAHSSSSSAAVHAGSPTHKRKPPAVPSRAHKPGNISSVGSTARNSVDHSPKMSPWSPEFVSNQDLAADIAHSNAQRHSEVARNDGKEGCRSLGFAALAQALRETGSKIGMGQQDASTRRNSVKKRRPRASDAGAVAEQEENHDTQLGLNIDEPVVVRKWESGDQSSGWTTFA